MKVKPKNDNSDAPYSIAEARVKCHLKLPYFTTAVAALYPIEVEGLGTFAVDEWGRMYYDKSVLSKWSLDACAGVILHEAAHVFLRHSDRRKALLGEDIEPWEAKLSNIAADLSINGWLRDSGVTLPEDGCFPKEMGLKEGLTYEAYYHLVLEMANKGQIQFVDQDGNRVGPCGGKGKCKREFKVGPEDDQGNAGGGSCADGIPRPYEHPGPGKSDTPALDELAKEMIRRDTAREIERQSGIGNVPGSLLREAKNILEPKVDPFRELEASCHSLTAGSRGYGEYSYRRMPRRSPCADIRLPMHYRPTPNVMVLVDTSGSMGQDDLARAVGVIKRGLSSLPPGSVRVASADTEVHLCKDVYSLSDVELCGGGGTDMDLALRQCGELKPTPDAIVCVSDGYTGWPQQDIGVKVLACITRSQKECPVPPWIKTIYIHEEA